MHIDKEKLDLALARECKTISDLRGFVHPTTLQKIRNDPNYLPIPKIVGKIAKALNVDVTEIIKED